VSQEDKIFDDLLQAARSSWKNAHTPYSKFKVGAAVYADNKKIYSGCNVEVAVMGDSLCAERVAVSQAISDGAKTIEKVLVVSDADVPCPPCGGCRQFIYDFATPETMIYSVSSKGEIEKIPLLDLLPGVYEGSKIWPSNK